MSKETDTTLTDVVHLLTFLEESDVLGPTDLNRLRRAIRKLMRLRERLRYLERTAKENPSLVTYTNPPKGALMSENVHQIRYRHIEDDNDYFHDFAAGVQMIALDNGNILLMSDKVLWEDFDL